MKRALLWLMVCGLGVSSLFSRGTPHLCKVTYDDKVLIDFDADVGEEVQTTKSLAIPGANLIATAHVYYTDELIGFRWGKNAVLDVSTTLRLDVGRTAASERFSLTDNNSLTRANIEDFGGTRSVDICNKVLSDRAYAIEVALNTDAETLARYPPARRETAINFLLPILVESCKSYLANREKNVISTSRTVAGKRLVLQCREE